MNTKIGNLSIKQIGIAVLAAVAIALWGLLGPALDAAINTGSFVMDWAVFGFTALKVFLSTLVALFLTDRNGNALGIGPKR